MLLVLFGLLNLPLELRSGLDSSQLLMLFDDMLEPAALSKIVFEVFECLDKFRLKFVQNSMIECRKHVMEDMLTEDGQGEEMGSVDVISVHCCIHLIDTPVGVWSGGRKYGFMEKIFK